MPDLSYLYYHGAEVVDLIYNTTDVIKFLEGIEIAKIKLLSLI